MNKNNANRYTDNIEKIKELFKDRSPFWMIHYVPDLYKFKVGDERLITFINAHTHGLSEFGQNEIQLVIPISSKDIANVLNVSAYIIYKWVVLEEKEIKPEKIANTDMKGIIIPSSESGLLMDTYLVYMDTESHGKGSFGYRLIVPDKNGLLPWDEKCEVPFKHQLVDDASFN